MVIYSYEAIGCILPIENQMKEPQKMIAKFGTINIAMFFVTLIYLILGFFGYWHFYQEEIQGSITLNLPQEDWYTIYELRIRKKALEYLIFIKQFT